MKKFVSSFLLILTFAAYAAYRRIADLGFARQESPSPNTANSDRRQIAIRGKYKDGVYVGQSSNAYYGNVQVQITVQSGNITDVKLLDKPSHSGTSVRVNTNAIPILVQEALQTQKAPVNMVSGATETSLAFNQSLRAATALAK